MTSDKLRRRLVVALADNSTANELADTIDAQQEILDMLTSNVETIVVGGRTIALSENVLMLNAECHDGGQVPDSGWLSSLESDAVAYQVPIGKKLVIKAVYNLRGSTGELSLGYADSAFETDSDGAELAGENAVFMGGGSGPTGVLGQVDVTTSQIELGSGPALGQPIPNFEVPAGKYPFMTCPNNGAQFSLIVVAELKDA